MIKPIIVLIVLLLFVTPTYAAKRPPWNEDHKFRRAYIIDEGLSALRQSPDTNSRCLHRLHAGRGLYIISTVRNKSGVKYYYVAVTRRTRGYLDADAVVSPSQSGDDERLLRLINASDDADKITLCKLFTSSFNSSSHYPDVLLAEAEEAEEIAAELSQRAAHRPPQYFDSALPIAKYWLNYAGLDRYSRLGLRFSVDPDQQTFTYDGQAYHQLLTRYPRSQAAAVARERLDKLTEKLAVRQ